MEKVSAIITTYKRSPQMLERAAKSVLDQTYENIELIIVDDSPASFELRDKVKAMAESLESNVKYIQHKRNMGACAARNTGIQAAEGEFVAFLDDDDEWLHEKIELQIEKFSDKDVALVYCGQYKVNETNQTRIEKKDTVYEKGKVYDKLIFNNFIGSTSFPMIRKSVLLELGGFNVNMKAAQDLELWLRIAKKYSIDYVEKSLVNYYTHDGEQISKNHKGRAESFLRLIELNYDYLKKHRRAHANMLFKAVFELLHIEKKQSRKLFWKAFWLYPFYIKKDLVAIKWLYIMPLIKNFVYKSRNSTGFTL